MYKFQYKFTIYVLKIKDIHLLKLLKYIIFKYKFNIAKKENDESANKITTFKLIA
jgi:hypothetical protein